MTTEATQITIDFCDGYKSLLAAVEKDISKCPTKPFHDYRGKMQWVIDRVNHYSEKTGIPAAEILDAWEKQRNYWYMNYYQECNQPEIKGENVRVFETSEMLMESIGTEGFRCPACKSISRSPYECDSGKPMSDGKTCDWKSYGLFGTCGRGVNVFVKEHLKVENIFMPIAWEDPVPSES